MGFQGAPGVQPPQGSVDAQSDEWAPPACAHGVQVGWPAPWHAAWLG